MEEGCNYCYGYGMWPEEDGVPVTVDEARTGMTTDQCFSCGSDNWYYEGTMCDMDEYEPDAKEAQSSFQALFKRFEENVKCVESSESPKLLTPQQVKCM